MPEREYVLAVVREWVLKAENDLKNASHSCCSAESAQPTQYVFTPNSALRSTSRRFWFWTAFRSPRLTI